LLKYSARQTTLLAPLVLWWACQRSQPPVETHQSPVAQTGGHDAATPGPSLDTLARDAALKALLLQHPTARLALDRDNQNRWLDTLQKTDSTYHPYFAVGDLNGDGRVDLVVTLYDSSAAAKDHFVLYYVPGTERGFGPPQELGRTDWLANAGLFVDHGVLSVGEFYSDVSVTYHWDSLTHQLSRAPCDTVGPFTCLR